MAGEEKAWRPPRFWRWTAEPATSLDEVPRWIGRLGYAAGLTILGGPVFCYLAYQLGQRDGVALRSTEQPYAPVQWRLPSWPLPQLLADKRAIAVLAGTGILLAVIGAFLPWATLTEPSVGEITRTGIEVDGLLTLVLALTAAGFLAWGYWGEGHGVGRTTLVLACGLTISGIAVYDMLDTNNLAEELRVTALVDLGVGIYVTLAGGLLIGAAGILGILSRQQVASEPDDPAEFLTLLSPWALLAAVLYLAPLLSSGGLQMPLLLLALAAPLVACLIVAHTANLCYKQGLRVGAQSRVAPESLITPQVWTWAIAGVFLLGTLLIYYLTYTGQTVHNHPVRLADSFLQGRLDIAGGVELTGFLDMACPDPAPHCDEPTKAYPLEPPGTALVVLVGVAIYGLSLDQTLVSVFVGAITAAIAWLLCRGIMKERWQQVALPILFAFGTIYWWNVTYYGVWYFNEAVVALFLFAAVYETLVGKRPLTAGLLLGAAHITRYPAILGFPFFIIMFSDQWLRPAQAVAVTEGQRLVDRVRQVFDRIDLKPLLLFGIGAGVFVIGFGVMNIVRFETPSPRATYDFWHAKDELSVPGGFLEKGLVSYTYYEDRHKPLFFEKPIYMTDEKPYLIPSWSGAAFWATTPAFLYAFLAAINKRWLRWLGALAMGLSLLVFIIVPNLGRGPTSHGWLDRTPYGATGRAIVDVLDFLQWDTWARWDPDWHLGLLPLPDNLNFDLNLLPFYLLPAVSIFFAFRTGNKLVLACWAAVIPVQTAYFLTAATGWPQFGYRYVCDYAPFALLLTWQGMGTNLRWHHFLLIGASVLLCFGGVLWVNQFDRNLVGGFHWANW
jgi:hypothetical protein